MSQSDGTVVRIHPLLVRITHWINALAIALMVLSGWRIYNASPLFDFKFPNDWTLGGWLAGALQWHFAAMWLLALNGLIYVGYGILSGHFKRKFLPLSPRAVLRDIGEALRGRLAHDNLSVYNAAQRAAYLAAILLAALLVLSGLVIWKPVQFHTLGLLTGDYERGWDDYEARRMRVHDFPQRASRLPQWDGSTLTWRKLWKNGARLKSNAPETVSLSNGYPPSFCIHQRNGIFQYGASLTIFSSS